jgi:hypothetical protein
MNAYTGKRAAQGKVSEKELLDTVARRAFDFFYRESHPETGQTKDRAHNLDSAGPDTYTISSIASTGYALAALPIGVERGWIKRAEAQERARVTLDFLHRKMPQEHGFFYHFVDWKTGERVWKCELSSIDTTLCVMGALAAGQFFGGETRKIADAVYARVDWQWMQKGGPRDPQQPSGETGPGLTLCMGWKPETGFLEHRWYGYSEASYIYLMAMGSPTFPLPAKAWDAWGVVPAKAPLEGYNVLGGPGPLFMAQMTPGYFDLRGLRDRAGYDWWTNFENAHRANYAYCARHPDLYPRHEGPLWGITACDQPPRKPGEGNGYGAQEPVDGRNDGTVAPTAALAGVLFTPNESLAMLRDMDKHYRSRLWGRYGFSNAFNPRKDWFDRDVIGIDLGMMLLAIENRRSGLLWRLMGAHPMTKKAMTGAGFTKGGNRTAPRY